ncbi:MAG: prepilin-type N-terminal cleavage/methylation domain-containing protein [Bdellovibrio sp.]
MKTMLSKMMRIGNRGFSLIELMVVVAIIGILATLAIPSVTGFVNRARQSEARTNLSQIYSLIRAYEIDPANTGYPASTNGLMRGTALTFGYSPEGSMRYNIGFSDGQNTSAYCGAGTSCIFVGTAKTLNATNVPNITEFPTTNYPNAAWVIGAVADLGGGDPDGWNINRTKVLSNARPGL